MHINKTQLHFYEYPHFYCPKLFRIAILDNMLKEAGKEEICEKYYFQIQDRVSLLCGLHSVNNILGENRHSKDSMNQICYELSDQFINPHKHVFGGDYDVNVLMIALQQSSCTTEWFDRRINQFKIEEEKEGNKLVGYLINIFTGGSLLHKIFKVSPRHWISVKKRGDNFQFMNSKEQKYQILQKDQAEQRINKILHEFSDPERRAEVIEVYQCKTNE